ncbi:unnamed protein product [Musa textilis]
MSKFWFFFFFFFVSSACPVVPTLGTSAQVGTYHVVDRLACRFGPSFTENSARKRSCPLGESLLSRSTLCLINQDTIYNHMKAQLAKCLPQPELQQVLKGYEKLNCHILGVGRQKKLLQLN